MSNPTEASAENPDALCASQQKVMTMHSQSAPCTTSNDDRGTSVSDKKMIKENQNTEESSQNGTNPGEMIVEKGLVRAESLEPDESSPSSGVVSPGPSSVTSQDSSQKSEDNQPNKPEQTTPLHVVNNSTTSENGTVDGANSNEVDSERHNSTARTVGSSPSSKIHQDDKNEASLKLDPPSRKRSDSIQIHSASRASPASSDSTPKQGQNLRRGKWTLEEEAYVARVIQDFNNGFLDAPAGTTLRTFLSDKLSCDPMRITKKFTGDSCIGKRVFHPAVRSPINSVMIDKAQVRYSFDSIHLILHFFQSYIWYHLFQSELKELERRWRVRLSKQRHESEKKQAASAAASAAASVANLQDPSSSLGSSKASSLSGNRVVVARTASWLDRANAILSTRRSSNKEKQAKKETYDDEVKNEMKEVELLIQEGPTIQKSSGLLLQKGLDTTTEAKVEPPSKRKVSVDQKNTNLSRHSEIPVASATERDLNEKEDKRMRKSLSIGNVKAEDMKSNFNLSSGEAEDAASFIGFISSVREEAAEAANSKKRCD